MISSSVTVGNVILGAKNPVIVQSMTNTDTSDTIATVNQIMELANAGCRLVRVSARNIVEAENLRNIRSQLCKKGIDIPLIADVHFNPRVAEVAALHCEKVRINPGNYISDDWDDSVSRKEVASLLSDKLLGLTQICKNNNTVIRIGVNHGSLSKRILAKYGNTITGMVESLLEFVEAFRILDFHNIVVALKASDVMIMIESNLLLKKTFDELGYSYPIHLGVTEAGNATEGRIKSAAGIGYLLLQGIGDTIRVSLAENPVNEVPVANLIAKLYGRGNRKAIQHPHKVVVENTLDNISVPVITEAISEFSDFCSNEVVFAKKNGTEVAVFSYENYHADELLVRMAVDIVSSYFIDGITGLWLKTNQNELAAKSALVLLQILGLRRSFPEFVACPTCARTTINVEKIQNELKAKVLGNENLPSVFRNKSLKIAVMGCVVNGLGEMRDADFGIVGKACGKANIYYKGELVEKNIDENNVVVWLLNYLSKM